MKKSLIIPLIAFALLALLAALWAGLQRLGMNLPGESLSMQHGPLMVSGFLGTLVTLERAVALKRKWMFAAPVFTGLGWVSLLALPGFIPGALLLMFGSLAGVGILVAITRREPRIFTATMLVGSLTWFTGNLLWLMGQPVFQVVLWWQAFLVLTIAGERLELNRVLRPTRRSMLLFVLAAGLYLGGVILASFFLGVGARVAGAGMLCLAAWFLRHDIALRNLRHRLALTRYIASCLAPGFVWLAVGGVLNLVLGATYAGPYYDAALHAVFVGFVISMIFGHAPIIFPALLGIPISFRPFFYIQLGLLHLSLVIRIAGDLLSLQAVRQWGGVLNEVALLVFLGATFYSIRKGAGGQPSPSQFTSAQRH